MPTKALARFSARREFWACFCARRFAARTAKSIGPGRSLRTDACRAAIDAALKRGDNRVAVAAVHGLRGVGKTTLAAAYAERRQGDYRATWWVRRKLGLHAGRSRLSRRAVRLGRRRKGRAGARKGLERLRRGQRAPLDLRQRDRRRRLRRFCRRGGAARAPVTSNAPAWRGVATPVEIRVWPKEVGADYLVARTGRDDERAEAEALSEALGGLPLAHEQAAAYCERLCVSFAEYASRFEATPVRLLDAEQGRVSSTITAA